MKFSFTVPVSKMRPTMAAAAPTGGNHRGDEIRLRQWERRVFKNSYTYKGRSKKVKGWSVKLQLRGERHTLALKSSLRSDAAREAAQLHGDLVANGWASILDPERSGEARPCKDGASAANRLPDARYWKEQLVQRRYPAPTNNFSVRIEHDGWRQFFPLGTSDKDAAAALACSIYGTVALEGWGVAFDCFPRELTVGFHWQANPVFCTYTTFHSVIGGMGTRFANGSDALVGVVVVEEDRGIGNAFESCINAHAGARCHGLYRTPSEAVQQSGPGRNELWLVNRLLFRAPEFARLRRSRPDLCIFTYSVYEDSDHLFLATPGGTLGYFLKRTPPDRMLEPILASGSEAPVSPAEVLRRVKVYFRDILNLDTGNKMAGSIEHLTHREQEVLELLSRGCLDKEMATELGISAWTVHGYMKNIFEKLKVHTRTEAVVKYLQK